MKALSDNFRNAASDYMMMLSKDYPQKAILKLIGDRYRLSGTERSMLFRGITKVLSARERQLKICKTGQLSGQSLIIDAYNVLITIGSYLNGNTVFISNDNLLRDASEIHGKVFRTEIVHRAIKLFFGFIASTQISEVNFLVDSPVSHSGKLCSDLNALLLESGLKGSAITVQSPDFHLKGMTDGIIATSDSAVIDKTQRPIIDLPFHVLKFHFDPDFIDLRALAVQ